MMDLPLGALGRESASIAYNVIDFALLVFHCVGSAITKQGNCAMHTAKTKRDDFQINLKSSLSFLDSTSNTLFIIALALLVIPAVETTWLVSLKYSKRCMICTIRPHTTLIYKHIDFLTRKMREIIH